MPHQTAVRRVAIPRQAQDLARPQGHRAHPGVFAGSSGGAPHRKAGSVVSSAYGWNPTRARVAGKQSRHLAGLRHHNRRVCMVELHSVTVNRNRRYGVKYIEGLIQCRGPATEGTVIYCGRRSPSGQGAGAAAFLSRIWHRIQRRGQCRHRGRKPLPGLAHQVQASRAESTARSSW